MKKSTAVTILALIVLLVVLAIGFNALLASRSYVDCAARLASEAPSGDRLPPESFRRLSRALWSKRDVYLTRVLSRECARETGTASRGFGRHLVVLGSLVARLPSDQRENLAAVLLPAHGGRGLTHSARTEWGRPPEALTDDEMTWLFVVAQRPTCSKAQALPERERQGCAGLYEGLLSRVRSLDSTAPTADGLVTSTREAGEGMTHSQPQGFLAVPPSGKGPGVLVLHAWWGLNDTTKSVCTRLAEQGFVAFAPDFYHGRVADTIAKAESLRNLLCSQRNQPAGRDWRFLGDVDPGCRQRFPQAIAEVVRGGHGISNQEDGIFV